MSPGSRGNMAITMRGVAGGSPANLSVDQAIGLYVDGVLIGKQVGSSLDVAELERVEVLRGPQGTLYGRNSTGGAVNFVTRKPTGELGGKLSGTLGNEGLWALRGTLDTPTLGSEGDGAGTLKASLGAQTRKRDGFYGPRPEATNRQEFDDTDRQAYRVALRWEPTAAITIDYAYDRSEIDEANTTQELVGLTPLAFNPATGVATGRLTALQGYVQAGNAALLSQGPLAVAAAGDPTFGRWLDSVKLTAAAYSDLRRIDVRPDDGTSDTDSRTWGDADGHSLTAAWNFDDLGALGAVEFKSITAWRDVKQYNTGDLDGLDNTVGANGAGILNDFASGTLYQLYAYQAQFPSSLLQYPREAMAKLWSLIDDFGGAYGYTQHAMFEYEQFSQELQMVGATDRLQYAVGLYWFEDEGTFDNQAFTAVPVGGVGTRVYDNDTEAKAFYTQFTWTPPVLDDRLAITAGYRHTRETKGVTYRYLDDGASSGRGLFSGSPLNLGVNLDYTGEQFPMATWGDEFEQDFDNDSGSLTLAYQATGDTNVFLRWATGYRSGGFNGEVYNNPFDEETIEQWELGVKSDVVPGVLRVNASIFAFTYDDMQIGTIKVDPNTGTPTSGFQNAGKAERWGSEIELLWVPTDDLRFAASWAHLDGDFEEYPPVCGTGAYLGTCIDLDDRAVRSNSADDQLSLVTDWVFASTDRADFMAHLELFWNDEVQAAAIWSGSYSGYPYVFDDVILEDKLLVNARIGIENVQLPSGTLRASLWARNLTDEEYNSYGINFGVLGPIAAQYGEPRTYGIDVTWEF
ncbi:MAG: hypothetical protein CALGDGBN_00114 [Pseudomonadales bacterium]|nr:hypothetical protein [Pseudomonadales bacterium]